MCVWSVCVCVHMCLYVVTTKPNEFGTEGEREMEKEIDVGDIDNQY